MRETEETSNRNLKDSRTRLARSKGKVGIISSLGLFDGKRLEPCREDLLILNPYNCRWCGIFQT